MKPATRSCSSGAPEPRASLSALSRPSWLSEQAWPFEGASLTVRGARLAITDVGKGPALLMVHTGLWSFVWRDLIARLANDFRCVTFDTPGTGRSDRLPARKITLSRASESVADLIETLDLHDLTLVFHDLGGPPSIAGAAGHARRIRGLVAVNTFAWKPSGATLRAMLALMGSAPMREFDALTGLLARVSSSSFGAGRHLDRESRRAFRAGIGPDGLRAFHRYMHDARACDAVYLEAESALAGPLSRLPLLTIFGERNDPFQFQQRWKEMFPAAEQIVIARGNHFPMCDDPEQVANAIRSWHRARI